MTAWLLVQLPFSLLCGALSYWMVRTANETKDIAWFGAGVGFVVVFALGACSYFFGPITPERY